VLPHLPTRELPQALVWRTTSSSQVRSVNFLLAFSVERARLELLDLEAFWAEAATRTLAPLRLVLRLLWALAHLLECPRLLMMAPLR